MKRIKKIGFTNFIILISSLILVIVLIAFSFSRNAASAERIAHTWEVKNTIRSLSSSISEMESRKLAYIYTSQIKYKHAFQSAEDEYDSLLLALHLLINDNQSQIDKLQHVEEIVNTNFGTFNESISEDKSQIIINQESIDEMEFSEIIHIRLEEMVQQEDLLLEERNANYESWKIIILISLGIATIIVFLSLYNLINRIRPLLEELLQTKENLEVTNASLKNTLGELNLSNVEKEREIKAKKKAIEEKEKLNESLSVKNQQLDHFAYVASHDLQEPLRTVSNYLEIFQEDFPERVEGEATMYFQFINSAVERMRNLISGLLSFSRIGTSGEMEQIDLNKTIEKIKADFSAVIEEREILIKSDALPTVSGYRIELKQLFQNLIANAIKFSKAGIAPHIEISYEETDNFYNFHIKDNGIGIPDKDFLKIFDMFSRLHSTKDFEGQGIGLAFCKKIVELHYGNIWVTSNFGVGSTIHFTIKK
ncbi:ATP-binding protein [Aequorivita sp. CIP111184]|uniref:sensor histidine kinase n=1 Tax=Aequorivita sp. CIP111184 TaxID=2211356 RepID=UPI000DBC04CE|nr:sensor histidine kinase [Aequorivita sp. CIP111184]SRX54303.1 Phytochrome-like protein cph1 [Aequorivita sp. CIP111184]